MYRRVIEIAVTIVISERTPNATLANAASGSHWELFPHFYGFKELAAVSTKLETELGQLSIARCPDSNVLVAALIRFTMVASSVGAMARSLLATTYQLSTFFHTTFVRLALNAF
jgi:hypothetical protein